MVGLSVRGQSGQVGDLYMQARPSGDSSCWDGTIEADLKSHGEQAQKVVLLTSELQGQLTKITTDVPRDPLQGQAVRGPTGVRGLMAL